MIFIRDNKVFKYSDGVAKLFFEGCAPGHRFTYVLHVNSNLIVTAATDGFVYFLSSDGECLGSDCSHIDMDEYTIHSVDSLELNDDKTIVTSKANDQEIHHCLKDLAFLQ